MSSNILLVPMHLDALWVGSTSQVRQAMVDYSELPYYYKKKDNDDNNYSVLAHPPGEGRANLSEKILSGPLKNSTWDLPAGIHLHWALPDALTESDNSETDGSRKFPIVPNRWLVRRYRSGAMEKQWVVESDYLYPDLSGLDDNPPKAATVPFPKNDPFNGPYQPFRYMGRSQSIDSWSPTDSSAEYLTTHDLALTALGPFAWEKTENYGRVPTIDYVKATFAAFYPNSHSLFGFCDTDLANQNPQGVEYEVIGWYSDASQDYLNAWYGQYENKDDRGKLQQDFQQRFEWQFTLGDGDIWPNRTICYAKLTFKNDVSPNQVGTSSQVTQVNLALGNTGTEALSAYLASQIDGSKKAKIEEQLEALHLRDSLVSQKLDLGAKFKEARHSKGFSALPGGWLWSVRKKQKKAKKGVPEDTQQEVTLPEPLAHQLAQLNQLQQEYDRAWDEIDSMGDRIFSDWYKLMAIKYPGDKDQQSDINFEDAFMTVAYSGVIPLRTHIAKTGGIQWQKDLPSGQLTGTAVDVEFAIDTRYDEYYQGYKEELEKNSLPSDNSGLWQNEIANCGLEPLSPDNSVELTAGGDPNNHDEGREWKITNPIKNGNRIYLVKVENGTMHLYIPHFPAQKSCQLLQAINEFNQQLQKANSNYVLKAIPSENYWQAKDLSLLMTGDAIQPSPRYGCDGTLACQVIAGISDGEIQNLPRSQKLLDAIAASAPNLDAIASSQWTQQPWHPFMLEWGVEFFPNPKQGDIYKDSKGHSHTNYGAEFITRNYDLNKNAVDLVDSKEISFDSDEKPYQGFSILTPHPKIQLKQRIAAYLSEQCDRLPSGYQEQLQEVTIEEAETYLDAHIDALLTAYSPSQQDDPIETALKAYQRLQNLNCLSQSLGGFNSALLMQQRTMQLAIADPFGSSGSYSSMQMALQVGGVIKNTLLQAPIADRDFTPIRGGRLGITQLRLVDSFGQINQLDIASSISSELLPLKFSSDSDHRFFLPPRFAQPARLSFRWLSALLVGGADDVEANVHPATNPICGWVLPNNLDSSLMVYDSQGQLLGLVNRQGCWQSAPGRDEAILAESIANPHLRKMVQYLTGYGSRGSDYFNSLLSVIDNALENIDPENFAQHQGLALLMGRPLALVRAQVKLELKGFPARDKSWYVFEDTVHEYTEHDQEQNPTDYITPIDQNPDRFTRAFNKINVPIRIGEYNQLNDGVVGYWQETADGDYGNNTFYAPQSGNDGFGGNDGDPRQIMTEEHSNVNIQTSANDEPKILTMLVDPRGSIHATSGMVPTQILTLSPDEYTTALQKIEVTFLTAPILTDGSDYRLPPGQRQVHLALPKEAGYTWSWLANQNGNWSEIDRFATTTTQAKFAEPQQICDGWLALKKDPNSEDD